jgi:hypothetical protein
VDLQESRRQQGGDVTDVITRVIREHMFSWLVALTKKAIR